MPAIPVAVGVLFALLAQLLCSLLARTPERPVGFPDWLVKVLPFVAYFIGQFQTALWLTERQRRASTAKPARDPVASLPASVVRDANGSAPAAEAGPPGLGATRLAGHCQDGWFVVTEREVAALKASPWAYHNVFVTGWSGSNTSDLPVHLSWFLVLGVRQAIILSGHPGEAYPLAPAGVRFVETGGIEITTLDGHSVKLSDPGSHARCFLRAWQAESWEQFTSEEWEWALFVAAVKTRRDPRPFLAFSLPYQDSSEALAQLCKSSADLTRLAQELESHELEQLSRLARIENVAPLRRLVFEAARRKARGLLVAGIGVLLLGTVALRLLPWYFDVMETDRMADAELAWFPVVPGWSCIAIGTTYITQSVLTRVYAKRLASR